MIYIDDNVIRFAPSGENKPGGGLYLKGRGLIRKYSVFM